MSMDEWMGDVESTDDDSEDTRSMFGETLLNLAEDGDISSLTVETIKDRLSEVDRPEVIEKAVAADDRSTAQTAYEDRLGEINESRSEDSDDTEGESEPESDPENKEESQDGAEPVKEDSNEQEDAPPEPDPSDSDSTSRSRSSDLSVDVSSLAPDATRREAAAKSETPKTLMVWGKQGLGKSHVAHSAPAPIAYIDTEGKADELADKFDGKEIYYFDASDYEEAVNALEQAEDLLAAYLDEGIRGTIVVDSLTRMWEYAKVDYAEWRYQTDDLTEVNFQSGLEGEDDWKQIKARHNDQFRDRILELPYNVVFTAGRKEDYEYDGEDFETKWQPDGERWNEYSVRDVVRLRVGSDGQTVGDLRKSAPTRCSFVGLDWPDWDSIYDAIQRMDEAERADGDIDVGDWDFGVVKGQPIEDSDDGGDD